MALAMADKAAAATAATATKKNVAATTLQALARGYAQRKPFQRIMCCPNFFAGGEDISEHDFDMEKRCEELAISIHLPLQQKLNIVISGRFPGIVAAAATRAAAAKQFEDAAEIVAAAATRAVAAKLAEDDATRAVAAKLAEDDAAAAILLLEAAKAEEAREIEGKKRLKCLSRMFYQDSKRIKERRLRRDTASSSSSFPPPAKKNLLIVKKTFNSVGRVRLVLANKKKSSRSSPLTSSIPEQQEVPTVRKAPRRSSPLLIPSSKQQDLRARLDEFKRKKKEKKEHDNKLKKKKMWRC